MSPDEILADLRDIHIPAGENVLASDAGFNFWPLVIVIVLLASILAVRLWRRGGERRKLRQAIEAFAASPSEGGMSELLSLRSRVAADGVVPSALPPACFTPEGAEDTKLLSNAALELRRLVA